MNRQALFDRHVRELAACVAAWDEYQLLMAAGTVRSLLIDGGSSLVHQVNRQRKRRIRYEVRGETALRRMAREDGAIFAAQMDGISPRLALVAGPIHILDLDAFLAHEALVVNGDSVSVRELVLQLANVEGGRHAGQPRDELQQHLHELNEALSVAGIGALAAGMRGVADVVVHSLMPLVTPTAEVQP